MIQEWYARPVLRVHSGLISSLRLPLPRGASSPTRVTGTPDLEAVHSGRSISTAILFDDPIHTRRLPLELIAGFTIKRERSARVLDSWPKYGAAKSCPQIEFASPICLNWTCEFRKAGCAAENTFADVTATPTSFFGLFSVLHPCFSYERPTKDQR
ncbi:hypothetical protein P175DRAFT_0561054 [Aspergillus ochraceoroseus IBT 24754]|uniref:Uncharacterized protein n=1 Tax=Aspergillus ochraceoroseus IBT 24754 TaxID=1392256 RepID=A0A2T5LM54_9EURO|nr:uncharacterized protein P175DRAFT_0561054 [Aspergillus ochraceoroseus IBT 24754]PTU17368.1 hypothetical protein P175DRAFT_0561054 [Aspergillus ochraceoroseus IBT 24754]